MSENFHMSYNGCKNVHDDHENSEFQKPENSTKQASPVRTIRKSNFRKVSDIVVVWLMYLYPSRILTKISDIFNHRLTKLRWMGVCCWAPRIWLKEQHRTISTVSPKVRNEFAVEHTVVFNFLIYFFIKLTSDFKGLNSACKVSKQLNCQLKLFVGQWSWNRSKIATVDW